LSHQINWEKHGVVGKLSGLISHRDIYACNESVCGDSRFDAISYQIADLLDARMAETTDASKVLQMIERIAATDKAAAKSSPNLKIAIVTSLETVGSLSSYYASELTDSSWVCEIFETMAEARAWIAVPRQ